MVCDHAKLKSSFQVAAPYRKGMHDCKQLLFPRRIIYLSWNQPAALKSKRAPLLIEDGPNASQRGIRVDFKRFSEVRERQARGLCQCSFDLFKRNLALWGPLPQRILSRQSMQRHSELRKMADKLAKVSCKPQERAQITQRSGPRPVGHGSRFARINFDPLCRDNVAKV